MKMYLRGTLIFAFIMMLLSVVLFVQVLSYPARSRLFPLIMGIGPLFIFSFVQIVKELRGGKKAGTGGNEEKQAGKIEWKKTIIVFSWVLGFMILVGFTGFLVAIPAFSLLFLTFYFRENWRIAMFSALLTTAVIYLLFIMVFDIPLYKGFF